MTAPVLATAEPTPAAQSSAPDPEVDTALELRLEQFLDGRDAEWDVWAEPLDHGAPAHAQRNVPEDGRMVSASLIKLFIMGAVYAEIEAGALAHDAVYPELRQMITVSDNDAANRLIRLLGGGDAAAGMAAVNAFAASIDCPDTRLNRLMLADNGLENDTSAADCAQILRLIYRGACVSETWSAEMLELLQTQTVNNRIPQQLPPETAVAHKTGDLPRLCSADVGIVFTPRGDYLLCVICNHSSEDAQTAEDIAALSRLVYDYYADT